MSPAGFGGPTLIPGAQGLEGSYRPYIPEKHLSPRVVNAQSSALSLPTGQSHSLRPSFLIHVNSATKGNAQRSPLCQTCCGCCQQPRAGVYQLWWQPCGQCTSSSSSVATVYQLQQLFHLARNQASTRRVGEFKFITPAGSEEIALWSLSPEEEFHRLLWASSSRSVLGGPE